MTDDPHDPLEGAYNVLSGESPRKPPDPQGPALLFWGLLGLVLCGLLIWAL